MYLDHKNMENKIEYRSSHIYTTIIDALLSVMLVRKSCMGAEMRWSDSHRVPV